MASRILVDALAFLATAAKSSQSLVPSRVVDEGWHALILHTGLYHGLCVRLGGGFIHHVPERPDPANRSQGSIERTVDAIEAAGYTVDRDLWRGPHQLPRVGGGVVPALGRRRHDHHHPEAQGLRRRLRA